MIDLIQFVAVLSCSLFAGAAIYINFVEHPARMGCGTEIAATVWAPSYKRATVMQVALAVVSTIAGVSSWLIAGEILWLIGAMLIFSVMPFTLIAIMPANKQLLDPGLDRASASTRALLEKWGKLHGVRSVRSLAAAAAFLVSILQA